MLARASLGIPVSLGDYADSPQDDGVVILYSTPSGGSLIRYNLGRTLVHEAGHRLGLLHIFEVSSLFSPNDNPP